MQVRLFKYKTICKLQTRKEFAESGGEILPKMCGAMDGGAQAHRDVLVAFFVGPFPLALTPNFEIKLGDREE